MTSRNFGQFWTPPSPIVSLFITKAYYVSTLVTKSLTPLPLKIVTSFIDDHKTDINPNIFHDSSFKGKKLLFHYAFQSSFVSVFVSPNGPRHRHRPPPHFFFLSFLGLREGKGNQCCCCRTNWALFLLDVVLLFRQSLRGRGKRTEKEEKKIVFRQ